MTIQESTRVNEQEKKTKEELKKEFKEFFSKFVKVASKDEILSVIYETFVTDEDEREAKADLVAIVEKVLSICIRYFEFRIRELTDRGVLLKHSYTVERFWDGVRVTIDVKFGKDAVMDMAKWLEFIKMSRMSDAQVKKVLLKRLTFKGIEQELGVDRIESPKDKLREKAEEIMEGKE
jgi:Trp operon repressor